MERNSFKEYSVNTHNIKRRAATNERLFGRFDANREWKQNQTHITSEYYYPQIYISREYSTDMANIGLGCLHVNIRRILAMELDMCKSILLDSQAQEVDLALLASVAALLV